MVRDPEPWRTWPIGARVVVRRRLAEGGYSDAVGHLTARGAESLTLQTRRGEVEVPFAIIAIGRLITPPAGPHV